jgi:succinate dehydrogenase flavin-adding protein (antitoxin of CptAB toxin-antitoxin module)
MELTDEELDELHSLLQETLLYGDDELVYSTTESGRLQNERLSSVQRKVEDEAKRRKLWWG